MVPNLQINPQTGLLEQARYRASPHHDDRPVGVAIDMVVIHNISLPPGEFGTSAVEQFFCGELDTASHPAFTDIQHLHVAAHLFIRREGEVIQFVPFHRRAWHAGRSTFQGRSECNDFSIGIELEGTDHLPYEAVQYAQLSGILRALMQTYPTITRDRIVGHVDIAPMRKTDPGPAFDWSYLQGLLT